MPDNRKKGKGRRAYLNDFQTTVNGEYIYCGAYYSFAGKEKERKLFQQKLLALSACSVGCGVVSGCVPAPGTLNCFYVLLPYLGSLLSGVSLLWAAVRLAAGGGELREYVYHATVEQLPARTALSMGFAGLSLLGELLYWMRSGAQGQGVGLAVFLAAQALALGCAVRIRRAGKTACWRRSDKARLEKAE